MARSAPAALLLGAPALTEAGLRAAARIAAATGARVLTDTFVARAEWGRGLPDPPRLPYFPEQARAALAGVEELVLAGARPPVTFFADPDMPSSPAPEGAVITTLAQAAQDGAQEVVDALERVADLLGAPDVGRPTPGPSPSRRRARSRPRRSRPRSWPACPRAPSWSTRAPRRRWPISRRRRAPRGTPTSAHVGGAIGQGPPVAVGAALAAPDRPVIAMQADGSGLYTVQALWTQAREGLNITTVVCANRRYRILQVELARAGHEPLGPAGARLTGLDGPHIDWVHLAAGFGVPGRRVTSADDLAAALEWALADGGPHLIEAVL